jgi:hypothetical protein
VADSVTIDFKPDVDESARVHYFNHFRTPAGILGSLILDIPGLAAIVTGIRLLVVSPANPVFGLFLVLSGVLVIIIPQWSLYQYYRFLFRRTLEKGDLGSLKFSQTGIESKKQHMSMHRDWTAVGSARGIREGLLLQLGANWMLISRGNFEDNASFERVVGFARDALGSTFKEA